MHIYLGADHRGYHLREKILKWLEENLPEENKVYDLSAKQVEKDDDYVDIALEVAEKVVLGKNLGILICGSGVGMCVAANKVKGARAGLCNQARQVVAGRRDDDMNILCLGSDTVSEDESIMMVSAFLTTPFAPEERYVRRLTKIRKYESSA